MPIDFADRCRGTMLGLACGDSLGAALEFKPFDPSRPVVRDFLPFRHFPAGSYTDDAEMALGLAESIIEWGGVCAEWVGRRHADRFVMPPRRGYGPDTFKRLEALAKGEPPLDLPPSFGNGAVMRIAPLGLNAGDLSRDELREMVATAIRCTHTHPDAIDAATCLAGVVAVFAKRDWGTDPFSLTPFLDFVGGFGGSMDEVADKVSEVIRYRLADADALNLLVTPHETLGRHFAIRATEALAVAFWSFATHANEPEEAVIHAANLGGDADTIACIVGALCGAAYGESWIPRRWLDKLEDADLFRDAGTALAALGANP